MYNISTKPSANATRQIILNKIEKPPTCIEMVVLEHIVIRAMKYKNLNNIFIPKQYFIDNNQEQELSEAVKNLMEFKIISLLTVDIHLTLSHNISFLKSYAETANSYFVEIEEKVIMAIVAILDSPPKKENRQAILQNPYTNIIRHIPEEIADYINDNDCTNIELVNGGENEKP